VKYNRLGGRGNRVMGRDPNLINTYMNIELQRKRLQKRYRKLIRPSISIIKKPRGYHIDHCVPFSFLVDVFNEWTNYKFNELFLTWHNSVAILKPIPKKENLCKSIQARRSNNYGLTSEEIEKYTKEFRGIYERLSEEKI